MQAKVAVAATTVVAGAATVDRAASNDGPGDAAGAPSIAQAADLPRGRGSRSTSARCFRVQPPEPASAKPAPPPQEPAPAIEPAAPVAPALAEPVVEPPPAVEEPPAAVEEPAAEEPEPEAPKDEEPVEEDTYASDPDPPGPELPPEEDPAGGHEPTPALAGRPQP